MTWKLGVTQWCLPCAAEDWWRPPRRLASAGGTGGLGRGGGGLSHAGRRAPATSAGGRGALRVKIVSVVLNDLCKNGFVHSPDDPRCETAYRTMACGIETAARMGVPSVCLPSFFDNRIAGAEGYARTVAALRYLCGLGAAWGVTVYTENVLGADALARLFRDVGCANLRLLFDSQNYSFMAGLDAVPVFEAAKTHVGTSCM